MAESVQRQSKPRQCTKTCPYVYVMQVIAYTPHVTHERWTVTMKVGW